MAAKKPPKPKPNPPQPKPKPEKVTPSDYLRGSKTVGQKYTAWDTYGQGKPDFGEGAGPGDPYHEVSRTVKKPLPQIPSNPQSPRWGPPGTRTSHAPKWAPPKPPDFRTQAIRARLKGL